MSGSIHRIDSDGTINVHVEQFDIIVPVKAMVSKGKDNLKMAKNNNWEYESAGLSLSPKTMSGEDLCPHSSPACVFSCLNGTGMGNIFKRIPAVRIAKSIVWNQERDRAKQMIHDDLAKHLRRATKMKKRLCVRLNVFSDIAWENEFPEIFDDYEDVTFMDYTKDPSRYGYVRGNYWITLSRSENNEETCIDALMNGGNCAAVFHNNGNFVGNASKKQELPTEYLGFPVFDGDISDRRFDDPGPGYWIGLKLKAATKVKRENAIKTGFSVLAKV